MPSLYCNGTKKIVTLYELTRTFLASRNNAVLRHGPQSAVALLAALHHSSRLVAPTLHAFAFLHHHLPRHIYLDMHLNIRASSFLPRHSSICSHAGLCVLLYSPLRYSFTHLIFIRFAL